MPLKGWRSRIMIYCFWTEIFGCSEVDFLWKIDMTPTCVAHFCHLADFMLKNTKERIHCFVYKTRMNRTKEYNCWFPSFIAFHLKGIFRFDIWCSDQDMCNLEKVKLWGWQCAFSVRVGIFYSVMTDDSWQVCICTNIPNSKTNVQRLSTTSVDF